ncbi:uncharacterized protein FRV6_06846 [Fusarium oxysporum]|uniref:Uncharacterized protein n=1 Tax=Fusarium oxysporum TaxID=5507 RepID=A0A2H3TLH7_FUSOX|nr:uncharacterized protein FRV6_06846 [Fusarium oxysporum]
MPPGMVEAERDCLVLSRADLSHEIERSRVYGVEAKQRFIEAQEQMSALISILRRVLALFYPQGGMATCRTASTLGGKEYEPRDRKNHLKTWVNDKLILLISGRDFALGSPVSLDDGTEHGGSQHDPIELLGCPLPETDMVAPFNEYQIPPDSSMTRQFQAEKPSLKWSPPVPSAPSRRNIKQRTPSMSYGDEPAAQMEVGETDSGCLHPEGLRESFSDVLMQKLDLPQSCLDEAPVTVSAQSGIFHR